MSDDKFGGIPGHVWVARQRLTTDDDYRVAICDWLTHNGVDYHDVPMGSHASIVNGQLTIELWVRNASGQLVWDPDNPSEIMRRSVTVPVKVKPNGDVELWLMPRCETCGR